MPEKKLFLLDAMALIYRAYFALSKNPRVNSKGLNTSAILGFANTLYDVLKSENPTHIGVAFDTMAPTKRHEDFVEYKANREKIPEDLALSIPYVMRLLEAFNIPVLAVDGYEADDVIGTLAKQAEKEGFKTYMMTPDKDFGQLVSDNIFIYKPAVMGNKATVLGVKDVCEKYNIKNPEQLIDILGLWGDASDNIPGIPGIGETRSKELIAEYGSVEEVIANVDKLKGKLKENVINYAGQGIASKQLATIILDVPIKLEDEKLKRKEPDPELLKELLAELEFRTFAKRIFTNLSLKDGDEYKKEAEKQKKDLFSDMEEELFSNDEFSNIETTDHKYYLVDTKEKRKELIAKLNRQKEFCFDTETSSLDPNNTELVGMSFSFKPSEAYYVSLPDNYHLTQQVVNEFKDVLEDPQIGKIGQNLKFDISVIKWYDIELKGKLFDTMLAHYLIQPDLRHNMDFLAETYLKYKPVPIENLIGKKGKDQLSMRVVNPEIVKEYACEDADITLQLKNVFEPMLSETKTTELFENIEMPLVPVLSSMEAEGVNLDVKALNEFSKKLQIEIREVGQMIFEASGKEFNISSPKQLGEILFERLKITDKPKRTKTKQYSTGEDVLIKLVNKHPIVSLILDYRSLTKLKSTYVDSLPLMVNPRTGRIHSSFNQAVAATGRLSSNNPNLQNIPIRTEKGREIRKAFVPRNENYTLLSADYSQIELRIIAELSNDKSMQDAFRNGLDIHTATAAKVYKVDLEKVTSDMRRVAKIVNFSIVYGSSAFGLSEKLNIPRREAADLIEQYFKEYHGIKEYMDKIIQFARDNGYVETIMGRRRYLKDINSANSVVRGYAERNAINAPIQGSSADIIKIAMIDIYQEFIKKQLKSKMILQVHDELIFDVLKKEQSVVESIVKEKMVNSYKMSVPLEVEMNTGYNWLEAH